MSIPEFNVKEQWLGTGLVTDYTFDFTIHDPTHILMIIQDGFGNEVVRFRGDDVVNLAGFTFDPKNGGGTISLAVVLADQYVLTALLAPDAPAQTSEFRGKFSFTLEALELALDIIVCQIQRLAYFAGRSLKLSDLDDIDGFSMVLPPKASLNPGATLAIASDGSGFTFGATLGQIAGALGFATQAAASAAAAVVSAAAAAASAVAAAASAAAAQSGIFPFGSPLLPIAVANAGEVANAGHQEEMTFVVGNGGAVVLGPSNTNPQLAPGAAVGCRAYIVGTSDGNTVKFTNDAGMSLNGDCTLGVDDMLAVVWTGTYWSEMFRRR